MQEKRKEYFFLYFLVGYSLLGQSFFLARPGKTPSRFSKEISQY
jgi:hypothetical protein